MCPLCNPLDYSNKSTEYLKGVITGREIELLFLLTDPATEETAARLRCCRIELAKVSAELEYRGFCAREKAALTPPEATTHRRDRPSWINRPRSSDLATEHGGMAVY